MCCGSTIPFKKPVENTSVHIFQWNDSVSVFQCQLPCQKHVSKGKITQSVGKFWIRVNPTRLMNNRICYNVMSCYWRESGFSVCSSFLYFVPSNMNLSTNMNMYLYQMYVRRQVDTWVRTRETRLPLEPTDFCQFEFVMNWFEEEYLHLVSEMTKTLFQQAKQACRVNVHMCIATSM